MKLLELAYDPIISFYLKISQSNGSAGLPLFSETMLRLSFKEIFGSLRALVLSELELYRKLLVLHYTTTVHYTSITDLAAIMTCFDENVILLCIQNRKLTLDEWHNFYINNLTSVVYKEALSEMLYEYAIRYINLNELITEGQVKRKADDVQQFLKCSVRMPRQFYPNFSALLKNKLEQNQNYGNLTKADLDLRNIYHSIKHKLNYFVVKEMSLKSKLPLSSNVVEAEPPTKKTKESQSNVVNTSIEVIEPSEYAAESAECVEDERSTSTPEIEQNNKFYVYVDNDENEESYVEIVDGGDSQPENNEKSQDIDPQQSEETNIEDNVQAQADIEDSNEENQHIIDFNTAMKYLADLQAYAVHNEHFEALDLIDGLDSIFRTKSNNE